MNKDTLKDIGYDLIGIAIGLITWVVLSIMYDNV